MKIFRRTTGCSIIAGALLIFAVFSVFDNSQARAESPDNDCREVFSRIPDTKKVAVLDIREQEYNDLTRFGNLMRSRVEGDLAALGLHVTPRQEIGIIADDAGMFDGSGLDWNSLQAEVVVLGSYHLPRAKKGKETVQLSVKVVENGNRILGRCEEKMPMQPGWERLAAQTVSTDPVDAKQKGVSIFAVLDRDSGCYPNTSSLEVTVNAQLGTWLYLFSIGWDGTVSRLYPNKKIEKERSMVSDEFVFPPRGGKKFKLRVMGEEDYQSRESIVVVAGKNRMDFSKIPVAWHKPLQGEAAFSQRDFLKLLREQNDYTLKYLRYTVGPGCGPAPGDGFL